MVTTEALVGPNVISVIAPSVVETTVTMVLLPCVADSVVPLAMDWLVVATDVRTRGSSVVTSRELVGLAVVVFDAGDV